jgi:hypothetical protein
VGLSTLLLLQSEYATPDAIIRALHHIVVQQRHISLFAITVAPSSGNPAILCVFILSHKPNPDIF